MIIFPLPLQQPSYFHSTSPSQLMSLLYFLFHMIEKIHQFCLHVHDEVPCTKAQDHNEGANKENFFQLFSRNLCSVVHCGSFVGFTYQNCIFLTIALYTHLKRHLSLHFFQVFVMTIFFLLFQSRILDGFAGNGSQRSDLFQLCPINNLADGFSMIRMSVLHRLLYQAAL